MVIGDVIQYEILLLLEPELSEERENEIVQRIQAEVERGGGTWEGHDPWGRRKLAYEINHKGDGSYHLLLFSSSPETLGEISRQLRITDGALRHMAVRRLKAVQPRPEPRAEPAGEQESAAVREAS
jgi:small subunit ribosomal protein S6